MAICLEIDDGPSSKLVVRPATGQKDGEPLILSEQGYPR